MDGMKYKNNPANIRYNKNNNWLGLTGSNNGFCEFDTLEHGLRALIKLLVRYINVYKLTTVKAIISRFAPPSENNTRNYVSFVSGFLLVRGINPTMITVSDACIVYLVCAICRMETSTDVFLDCSHIVPKYLSNLKK